MSVDEIVAWLRAIARPEVDLYGAKLPAFLMVFMGFAILLIFLAVTRGPFRGWIAGREYEKLNQIERARLRTELMQIIGHLSGGEVDPVSKKKIRKRFSRPRQFDRVVRQLVKGGWIEKCAVERGLLRGSYANLRDLENADPALSLTPNGQEGLRLNGVDPDILFGKGPQQLMRGETVNNITHFNGAVTAGQIHTGSGDNRANSMTPQQIASAVARDAGLTSAQRDGLELAISRQNSQEASDGRSPVTVWLSSVSHELGAAGVDLVKQGFAQYLGLKD